MPVDAYDVQTHVAQWLNGGAIQGLDKVWAALPNSYGLDFSAFGSGEMRCQGVAYVEHDAEIRRSFGGAYPRAARPASGMKWTTFTVRLELCLNSTSTDWDAADRTLKKSITEPIKALIRADSSLGTWNLPNPLFESAGEGHFGIKTVYEAPYISERTGTREQWAYLTFTVNAWMTG